MINNMQELTASSFASFPSVALCDVAPSSCSAPDLFVRALPNNKVDHILSFTRDEASGYASFSDSDGGSLPKPTITDAIASGAVNLCHLTVGLLLEGMPEDKSHIKSVVGSALKSQYVLPL